MVSLKAVKNSSKISVEFNFKLRPAHCIRHSASLCIGFPVEWRSKCVASNHRLGWIPNASTKQQQTKANIYSSLGFFDQLAYCLCVVVVHIHSPFWWIACRLNRSRYSFVVRRLGDLLRLDSATLCQIKKISRYLLACKFICIMLDACRNGQSRVLYRFSMGRNRLRPC